MRCMIYDVGIKKFLGAFFILSVVAFGASCSSGETITQKATQNIEVSTNSTAMQSDDDSDNSQETTSDVKDSEEEQSQEKGEPEAQDGPRYSYGDSDYLFDQEKFHTFELTLSDHNLAYLDSAHSLEEYVPRTLTF